MKLADVQVGSTYIVKVSGALVPVKLESVCSYGGWLGRNQVTGREIRIRTAAKLRREYTVRPAKPLVVHAIRAWSGYVDDERPLCGADKTAADIFNNRTIDRNHVTCYACLEALKAAV